MLTSKDTNFIGYTYKKSDVIKSLEGSGMLSCLPSVLCWMIDQKYDQISALHDYDIYTHIYNIYMHIWLIIIGELRVQRWHRMKLHGALL